MSCRTMIALPSFLFARWMLLWSFLIRGLAVAAEESLTDSLQHWVTCNDDNDNICPAKATCCPVTTSEEILTSGCVPSDLGSFNATCCQDGTQTACGIGYTCGTRPQAQNKSQILDCVATKAIQDPLVQELPRYHLCTAAAPLIRNVYGLPIIQGGSTEELTAFDNNEAPEKTNGLLAYYSTHGDLTQIDAIQRNKVRMAIIVVHGATRNGDEYFCSMATAAERHLAKARRQSTDRQHQDFSSSSILVLAPRFPNLGDDDLELVGGGTALQWKQDHSGAWRYGDDAVYPFSPQQNVSSFDGVDTMVRILVNKSKFPALERLVVVGHSSGGQFVQRWALLTPFWGNSFHERAGLSKAEMRMHAVVANPSSYCYLIPERWINYEWEIPDPNNCPTYNQWEWGLDPVSSGDEGVRYGVRYLDEVMQSLKYNLTELKHRFLLQRTNVVYMIGAQDRCNISESKSDGWCRSHGLETTCADLLEGKMRLERHDLYYESLRRALSSDDFSQGTRQLTHKSLRVPNVGHDHSLMFHSAEGMEAIFGKPTSKEEKKHLD